MTPEIEAMPGLETPPEVVADNQTSIVTPEVTPSVELAPEPETEIPTKRTAHRVLTGEEWKAEQAALKKAGK